MQTDGHSIARGYPTASSDLPRCGYGEADGGGEPERSSGWGFLEDCARIDDHNRFEVIVRAESVDDRSVKWLRSWHHLQLLLHWNKLRLVKDIEWVAGLQYFLYGIE